MFHSAALRLTLWYLAIIMAVSIACSAAIYLVASSNLRQAVARQINFYADVLGPQELRSYSRLRQSQLAADQRNLKELLVFFNLFVLAGGGAASYALARRTMKPLEESLAAQSRFASDASHELRTPLAIMQSEIEVALRQPSLSKTEAIGLLQSNLEEVAKLQALSEGLLRLARNDAQEDFSQAVELYDVVIDAVARVSKIAAGRRIKLKSRVANAAIKGNRQYLTDLTAILLDNAIKYSPGGSVVTVSAGQRDRSAFIAVKDKGQGISKAEMPRIFERFYRSETSRHRDKSGGYGLGLAIAKKISQLHKGWIEVKSTPGKGSTFTVRLPLS